MSQLTAENFHRSSAGFLAAIDGLSPAQWRFKPDAEM